MAIDVTEDIRYEESDCLRNIPENLENSERYGNIENAIEFLDDSIESIKEAKNCLSNAINC